ncbi:MAG: MBL fold metallo-hydrolase [Planctomycetota bacterium]
MLSFCVLGSGSAGNCTLVRLGDDGEARYVLIDAGLSPRQTAHRLGPLGVGLDDISDVLLTHIDHDHFHPSWRDPGANRIACTWRAARRYLRQARAAGLPARDTEPFDGAFEMQPGTRVEVTMLPHDELGSTGFVIDHGGARLGFATDLGRVPETLLERRPAARTRQFQARFPQTADHGRSGSSVERAGPGGGASHRGALQSASHRPAAPVEAVQ